MRRETARGGGREATFRIRVRPGASRTEVVGFHDGALAVRVTAPPEKGRANRALLIFLAERLGLGRSDLVLVAGAGGRDKIVRVTGLSPDELTSRLAALAAKERTP